MEINQRRRMKIKEQIGKKLGLKRWRASIRVDRIFDFMEKQNDFNIKNYDIINSSDYKWIWRKHHDKYNYADATNIGANLYGPYREYLYATYKPYYEKKSKVRR